jgi:hypothetical protein
MEDFSAISSLHMRMCEGFTISPGSYRVRTNRSLSFGHVWHSYLKSWTQILGDLILKSTQKGNELTSPV